jgi:hypothetical protein
MKRLILREKVEKLRHKGKTYLEIQKILKLTIPKSTLSYWCRNIELPFGYQRKIQEYNKFNLKKAQKIALLVNKHKRKQYLNLITNRNRHLAELIKDKNVAKIALAMLYLGEGSKKQKGSLMFGNSDPLIISLFLYLLRHCYKIDENKFRCTLQCRADQDIKKLEKFWSKTTNIPLAKFYKARVDPRTIGKPSIKTDYKGVCRIDYFSAELFIELKKIAEIINKEITN